MAGRDGRPGRRIRLAGVVAVVLLASGPTALRAAEPVEAPTPNVPLTGVAAVAPPTDGERLFVTTVAPLLAARCTACHGEKADEIAGEYDLTTRAGGLAGGESGEPAILPGKPDASPLIAAVRWEGLEMPPKANDRLTDAEVAALAGWVRAGADWPEGERLAAVRQAVEREALARKAASDATDPWSADPSDPAAVVAVVTSGELSDAWTGRTYPVESLWAARPLTRTAPPHVPASDRTPGTNRPGHPIDGFLLARSTAAGLTPAGPADRRTLIRRLTFDLTGLPPTPDEVDAFLADDRPDTYERLVDRLLASSRHGERIATHWLDVVRYADSAGFSNDYERAHAWRYRDYVVRAFNGDLPYDRFLTEQLAGDELFDAAPADERNPEALIATGFLRMGPWEHTAMSVAAQTRQQFLDDVTQSVGETFLGLGMQCCKCHDHKFDPLPTRDYYRFQAVFAPVQFADRAVPWLDAETTDGIDAGLAHAETRLKETNITPILEADADAARREEIELGIDRLRKKEEEHYSFAVERYTPRALSVYAGADVTLMSRKTVVPVPAKRDPYEGTTAILTGGALESPGEAVTPGVPSFIAAVTASTRLLLPRGETVAVGRMRGDSASDPLDAAAPLTPDPSPLGGEGGWSGPLDAETVAALASLPTGDARGAGRRTALAAWMTGPAAHVTARVIVNRVWQMHFGRGLFATPNNIGRMGARPSHPELLDFLAADLIDHGWSIKRLHRLIVTSDAYRRAGTPPDPTALAALDPDNTLLTVYPVRRLSAEEIRDAMLAVSGELSPAAGGVPVRPVVSDDIAFQPRHVMGSIAPAYQPSVTPGERNRRTLYTQVIRSLRNPMLETFDQPNPDLSCERRNQSTVPLQALTLLNGLETRGRAFGLARRVVAEFPTPAARADGLVKLVYARSATPAERGLLAGHAAAVEARLAGTGPPPTGQPTAVVREWIEEQTGKPFTWTERLDLNEAFVADHPAESLTPTVRAWAEAATVLFNSNEFLYVD